MSVFLCAFVGYLRLVFWLSMATREPFGLGLLEKAGKRKRQKDKRGGNEEKDIKEKVNGREEYWSIENIRGWD